MLNEVMTVCDIYLKKKKKVTSARKWTLKPFSQFLILHTLLHLKILFWV